MIGTKKIFNYPKELTTLPEYTAHAGQEITVIRELTKDEYDYSDTHVKMYLIQATDGWTGHAHAFELIED